MKIGIMGYGHLGKCFAQGLLKTRLAKNEEIAISAASKETQNFAREQGLLVFDNRTLAQWADVLVISLKSAVFFEVMKKEVSALATEGKTVVSFMAGITIKEMMPYLGKTACLVRAIPNIAIADGMGITCYTKAPEVIVGLLKGLGYAFETEEKDIEKGMAFASCGIGFAAYLMSAYQESGVSMGFSPEESEKITALIFQGALGLRPFETTVEQVATKGGATEQGILCFEENKLPDILKEGIYRAYKRMVK